MTQVQTLQDLMERIVPRLKLRWLTARPESARALRGAAKAIAGQYLVGSLNCIHPNRLQVIGHPELLYQDILVEAVVRHQILRTGGYDAGVDCSARPADAIDHRTVNKAER